MASPIRSDSTTGTSSIVSPNDHSPVTRFLELDEVLLIAARELGEPVPVRDIGLLDSAVARPRSTVFGSDAYPDLWTKAAALLQSLVVNHALVDGNKRLGWLATVTFVALNTDVDLARVDLDTSYELVIEVATNSSLSVDIIAARLRDVLT